MDRRPRAAEPHACRAAERPQARRIRRSEGVTCRSRSRPFVFATRRTVRRAHDGRRDRRRTIVRRGRSDPSPSCLDSRSSARDTAGRGRPGVTCHGPGGCTGSRGADRRRRIGTRSRRRGASHSLRRPRRPIGVRCIVRSRAWRPSSMPPLTKTGTHGSRLAHVWRRADGQLVLLDFSWPGLDRAGGQSDSQSCRAAGGRLHARICSHHRAGRAAVGHDAVESTCERSAASAR